MEGNIAGVMLVVMVSIIIVNQQPSTDISITAVVAASAASAAAFAASASAAVDSTWMSTSRKESFWGYLMGGSCLACFYPVKSKR